MLGEDAAVQTLKACTTAQHSLGLLPQPCLRLARLLQPLTKYIRRAF